MIKQIRKPLFYPYKTDKFNAIINNYVYKHIIYILLLKKYYQKTPFDVFSELKKHHFFSVFKTLEEFHSKDKFYNDMIKQVLLYYYNFITGASENIELDKHYFLSYCMIVERIPIKKVISEWNYKNITQVKSEYLKKENIHDINELLKFKLSGLLPEPQSFPIFNYTDELDIVYDNYIVEITTKNTINFIPSVKKVIENNSIWFKYAVIINPRFELCEVVEI